MPPNRSERLAEIVEQALEHEGPARTAFVDERCGSDAELRTEVNELLARAEGTHDFIETPMSQLNLEALADSGDDLLEGKTIGDYRVVRLIGEGGMGAVYLAEDVRLGRQVALKLVRGAIAAPSLLRHFRSEERILAALNHANIARLYGSGATADGTPFFVMEYVDGLRIDRYCTERALAVRERLELFRKVCGAVQYAHQRLVIHRDLKPSNVLVSNESEPKLLDFGIGKVLDENSAAGDLTMTLGASMTPEYASPEQLRGDAITTASDVYSLGIVLYEMLTGRRPYRIENHRPAEIARQVVEQQLPKPSTALRRSGQAEPVTRRLLQGDLDNIVLMATRKEPSRRYASASQLSEDIRRHLEGLPVVARGESFAYRASKFVTRHRYAVAAALLVLLSLIGGVIMTLRQARVAEREKHKAQRISTFLERTLSFSNQSISSVSPVAQRPDVTVNEMLDQIAPQIETELADEPEVRARVLHTLASAYASRGQYAPAEKYFRAAFQIADKRPADSETAGLLADLGVLLYRRGELNESAKTLGQALEFYRRQQEQAAPDYRPARCALVLDYLGVVNFYLGHLDRAVTQAKEALATSSNARLKGDERWIVSFIKSDLGGILLYSDKPAEGESLVREAVTEFRQASGPPRWELGTSLLILGIAAQKRNQPEEALQYLSECETILRETLGHQNTYVANTLDREAAALEALERLEAAEAKAQEAVAIARGLVPSNVITLAGTLWTLGDILMEADRPAEGETAIREALRLYGQYPDTLRRLSNGLNLSLARALAGQERWTEAEEITAKVVSEATAAFGKDSPVTVDAANYLAKIQAAKSASPVPH